MNQANIFKIRVSTLILSSLLVVLTACATSPTGQRQLKLFPDSQMTTMGISAFDEMKKETPISKNKAINQYVNCVASAVYKHSGTNTKWELVVFEDAAVNAFALPGGKIGVYTGILPVASNQDQLAAVIGHEISHVIADHGNARVSAAFAAQTGVQLAQVIGASAVSPEKAQLLGLLGLGAQYGILMPYGRGQESEADILGLRMMASAGFDPRESVKLWQNMGKASGKAPPEFLSTHPSNETRIKQLQQFMPEAMKIYKNARAKGLQPACVKP